MPRAKVIGWTLIACGIAMRIILPKVAPPYDRVHSAMYAFYTFLVFVIGLSFVYFGMFGRYSNYEQKEVDASSERPGRLTMAIVTVILLWFAITLYEPD
jgi:hypothetical protein